MQAARRVSPAELQFNESFRLIGSIQPGEGPKNEDRNIQYTAKSDR